VDRKDDKGRRRPVHVRPHPFSVIQGFAAAYNPPGIIVSLSCGKDSVACLDVCRKHLPPTTRIIAYFMYIVRGLSFQDEYLAYLQRRYKIETIYRVPFAPYLAKWYRRGLFRHATAESRKVHDVKFRHIDAWVRKQAGGDVAGAAGSVGSDFYWIANGERACESVQRNAMLRSCRGVSEARGRVFPLTYWSEAMVWQYLRQSKVAMAPDYGVMGLGRSFASLHGGGQLAAVKKFYPRDYAKILEVFPLAETVVLRFEAGLEEKRGGGKSNSESAGSIMAGGEETQERKPKHGSEHG
jgi:phosphoadenosine phosphosulfate reductase